MGSDGDPNNQYLAGQGYNLTANFTTNMNPGGKQYEFNGCGDQQRDGGVILTAAAATWGV